MSGEAFYTTCIHTLNVIIMQLYIIVMSTYGNKTFLLYIAQVISMDDNCGEWMECKGVVSGCGEQEVGVASGSGWNL